ncbi:hypothetical protein Anas_01236 [Armadillidium nasatum]|uniref:Uncharacterized protein n=1 Tax=Armadillidium nasatum TaxID=96803 RepID=A0A5N5TMJ1_9CRUS|nr:hypothetical protein Anas_01236 [Armadillidium nasatum]
MFGGRQSGNNVPQNAGKDTLHITPHIAAHKSHSQSNGESFMETSQDHCLSNPRLTSIQAIGHVPGYRIGIPTSAIFTEPFQNSRNQTTHLQVPTIFTLPSSKSLPQDLSSHSKLSTTHENENTNSKNLSHIHNVGNQNVENITGSFIVPVPDRSPAYYRLVDGTTISISNQHQTVLVSAQNDDHSTGHIGHLNSVRQSHHGENSAIVTSSGAMTMPSVSDASHSHISVSGLSEGQLYVVPPQVITNGNSFLSSDSLLPEKLKNPAIDDVKIESEEHKDLVRQALQAAVVHNSHKSNSGHDIIAYDYGNDDIGDPNDCLVNEDVICHSTFCSQPNVKTQELLLMNVNVNQGQQSGNKLSGSVVVGPSIQENPNGGQVMVLDSSQTIDEAGNILPPIILSSRRRRTRLSEEAQAMRREKIANRMREKRANETQEQKEKRRLREAERMRRKRAQEDELSKERRRREAAERARLRRAKLSNEERELERKKAAARMRLRRQNENEEQKRLRRIKAAERMRKRRSAETPEERATRKHNIALKMKVKRQKKEEKENNEVNSLIHSSDNENTIYSKEAGDKDTITSTDSVVQNLNAPHLVSSGSLEDVPENLTLLQNENTNMGSHLLPHTAASILSAVELTHVATSISHSLKTSSPPLEQKDLSNTSEKSASCASGKSIAGEAQENHLQLSPSASRNSDSPVHQMKDLHLHHHHHLPHLHHHQETHNHSIYILPHSSSSQIAPIHLEQQ